jgi:8-oxo-dGTP pyrophosphatase MutT (NUDIX family)
MNQKNCMDIIRSSVRNSPHPCLPDDDLLEPTGVMVLLTMTEEIRLLFIQKADKKGYPWSNQMAFPGGHRDESDKSTRETALRELAEEMGIRPENVEVIGSLGHFQTINSKDIEAFIGIWNQKDMICHDPTEIARVFHIPLKYLVDLHREKGFHQRLPNVMQLTYPYEDVMIWGVTAKILYHLIEIILKGV